MNDRELLELAAKAAGISTYEWNPLIDDGDAFRLAVRCNIAVNPMTVDGLNRPQHESTAGCVERWTSCIERHNGDPAAATRRAIVRAAAELGRAL
ncbi:hypothetical protein [Phage blackswan219-6]|nr:hypothetical protein [Phage blackswan219-6]